MHLPSHRVLEIYFMCVCVCVCVKVYSTIYSNLHYF